MLSKKECIAMFTTLAFIEIRRKRLDLMKNRVSFIIAGSAPDSYWKLPDQRVCKVGYQRTS